MTSRNPIDVAFGYAAGFRPALVSGLNAALSDSAWYVLGPGLTAAVTSGFGANDIALSDTAGTLSVERVNPADTGTVVVNYLDADYRERVALYSLAASPATIDIYTGGTITARRANVARYVPGGNVGIINVKVGTGLVRRIAAGDGFSSVCLFTVPLGQPAILTSLVLAAQAAKPVEVRLRTRLPGQQPLTLTTAPARETLEAIAPTFPRQIKDVDFSVVPPVDVIAGIDIWAEAKRPTAGGTGEAMVLFTLLSQITADDPDAPGY